MEGSIQSLVESHQNEEEIRKYISSQKAAIKKAQKKLEVAKEQYKLDKKKYTNEAFIRENPDEYRKQQKVLAEAKSQIEERIDKLNQKVEKIKAME